MKKYIYSFIFIAFGLNVEAKVVLPSLFSDYMVLQQKANVPLWGKTASGKEVKITTTFSRKTYSTIADKDGNWKIVVATPAHGGPYNITISDGELTNLNNIMIGEVWICSGQSNMEMALAGWGKINNYQQEIEVANYPQIRLLQADHISSNLPLEDAKVANGGWKPCTPEYVANFSSVAYFFAREIYKNTGIPMGLIHTSWGGTIAEAWTSATTLKTMPDFAESVGKIEIPPIQISTDKPNRASVLYNAMIHPYIQFPIRGAIWYQGESNAGRAHQYQTLFPNMIKDWRKNWNQPNFPFYFVQLANFMKVEDQPKESEWAELREAQLKTLALPNTGMAVAIDIGDAKDIHPKNKQEVGRRLALIALAKDYTKKIAYSGPLYRSHKIAGNVISVRFSAVNGGLRSKDGNDLKGFAVAGADQKFYWAKAVIKGDQVVVGADEVPNPVSVRYGWANNPVCNLENGAGLPASPFRTDDWKGITFEKK